MRADELVRGAAALLVGVAGERIDVDTSALDRRGTTASVLQPAEG